MVTSLPKTFGGCVLFVLVWCTTLFVALLISAIAFRFMFTWSIDVMSWWREVLNNLAGAVGA